MSVSFNWNRVLTFTMIVLAIIGVSTAAEIFRHRLNAEAIEMRARRKADQDQARLDLSTMGVHGGQRREFQCLPNAHVALHMVQTMCAGSGEIFIDFPVADATSASIRYSTSPGIVYKIGGVASSKVRSELSLVQARTIERMVESQALILDARSPEGEDVGFPSFPLGMEGCVDGQYFAAVRLGRGMDEKFAKLWSGIDTTLKASLERLPDAPPVMCL
jgi:hypothetical protein